jgi:hypothetical protein
LRDGREWIPADKKEDDGSYYGAPSLPTVRGFLWRCRDKATYMEGVVAYEEAEANCNTCKHLQRVHLVPYGWQNGKRDDKGNACPKFATYGRPSFHPEDPMWMPCWESRRSAPNAQDQRAEGSGASTC